jgi:hypothetical protein
MNLRGLSAIINPLPPTPPAWALCETRNLVREVSGLRGSKDTICFFEPSKSFQGLLNLFMVHFAASYQSFNIRDSWQGFFKRLVVVITCPEQA